MRIDKHPILDLQRGPKVIFTFDGRELEAFAGETVAASLVANGITTFRVSPKLERRRGFFCGIGRCSSCNMEIDGVPNVRACVTMVAEGMDVRTQRGQGVLDAR